MDVEQTGISRILTAILHEFSSVTDYRTLRDSIPQRLATQLKCRYVLLYFQHEETLQLAASAFREYGDDGSPSLLSLAHVDSLSTHSSAPEACAWRERRQVLAPANNPTLVAVPMTYRQRGIGVLVVVREQGDVDGAEIWSRDELALMDALAGVVALLLENSRLLERDRERIYELSLLNSISSQMNHTLYDIARLRSIVLQRVREIANVDVCALLEITSQADIPTWLSSELWSSLVRQAHEQYMLTPLVLARTDKRSEYSMDDYFARLPEEIKTLVVMPLYSVRTAIQYSETSAHAEKQSPYRAVASKVLGIIVAGYYRPCKLRREEQTLLQILGSQVSAAWENMLLMEEVIDARNEAHRLLLQVLDDQRTKELILESIPSGLITTDSNGQITTFNRAATTILGYHPYEVLGLSLRKVLPPRHTSTQSAVEPLSLNISTLPYERYVLSGAGGAEQGRADVWHGTIITEDRYHRELVLEVDMTTLYSDRGERVGILTTFNDVTSIHRLEEEKRRLDRLASLGVMAANVAHEVRNPLASIKTSMLMLRGDLKQQGFLFADLDNGMRESVEVVLKEVERLDLLVRDLLLFARPRQLRYVQCDLVTLCDQVLNLLQPQFEEANIDFHRVYEVVPAVWVDVGQMEQVLLNIYKNALQAMPEGGIITVACRCIAEGSRGEGACVPPVSPYASPLSVCTTPYKQHVTAIKQQGPSTQWVELVVRDTGSGMTSDQLAQIFQPFYTTKAHGIGLGLPITRRLIEDHGGSLQVESQLGFGTTITIHLPVLSEEMVEENEGQ
jgi:signal transduction histidine kinase/GAF domain-containing protein